LDGVYIAVCHYMSVMLSDVSFPFSYKTHRRMGASENAWVNVRRELPNLSAC
jgi:hypothetical protein